jgi:hypothetical protein
VNLELRATIAERGKRDLFFLAKELLGEMFSQSKLVERVHKPVCDFFVRKEPDLPISKQSRRKNRALFDPRGHLKTTLDIADMVQWALCFPNIRMLLMSGTKALTKRMVDEWGYHFERNRIMREVYPEYCNGLIYGEKGEVTLPNRSQFWREPTLSIATADSVKASGHYDLRKGDDVVNEDNSKNPQQLKETTNDWKATRPLVPRGYSDFIDTRYDFSDCGGDIIESNPPIDGKVIDLDGFGQMWHGKDWDIFIRACWKFDQDGKKTLLFPEEHCTDEDFDPEKENLDAIQREDPGQFSCQYLNNPSPTGTQSFQRAVLEQQTILRSLIPATVTLFMAWYLGFNPEDPSDPAVGIVGGFSPDGSLYIIDCFRGLWSTDKIIDCTFTAHRKWSIRRIGFNDKNGPILIGPGIESKMREHRVFLPVEYLPVPHNPELMRQTVQGLVPLLSRPDVQRPWSQTNCGKLFFSTDMPYYDQMLVEFTRFPKYKYAGIPFAIATLAQHYRSAYQRMLSNANQQEPVGEIYGVQHTGMFDDMQSSSEDCQELSGGIVG